MNPFPFAKIFSRHADYADIRSETIRLLKVANAGYISAHSRTYSLDIDNLIATLYSPVGPLAGFHKCSGPRSRASEVERITKVLKAMSDHYALSLTNGPHYLESIYVDATSMHDSYLSEKLAIKFSQEEKKRKAEELRFSLNTR